MMNGTARSYNFQINRKIVLITPLYDKKMYYTLSYKRDYINQIHRLFCLFLKRDYLCL